MTLAATLRWARRPLAAFEHGCAPDDRIGWADIAKGISIVLLVLWHTNQVHPVLSYIRMPLFFFVSGFFAFNAVVKSDWNSFLRNKTGNMIYLYALWSGAYFLLVEVVSARGAVAYFGYRWLNILWDPPLTMWFIYALAISFLLARFVRWLPVGLVLTVSILAFLCADLSLSGESPPFADRIAWLFPFFWFGLVARRWIEPLIARYAIKWPLFLGIFFIAAFQVEKFDSPLFNVLYMALSLTGICGVVLFANCASTTKFGKVLAIAGGATIYTYLMHRIFLYYLNQLQGMLALDFAGISAIKVAVIVIGCIYIGRRVSASRRLWWLARAPFAFPTLRPSARALEPHRGGA